MALYIKKIFVESCITLDPIEVKDAELLKIAGNIKFESLTLRAFKCPATMEDRCEDYGQVAIYCGGIHGSEFFFDLDDHHHFEKGRAMLVCGNTAAMLQESRFAPHFKVMGDRAEHFGLFDCTEATINTIFNDAGACC